MADAALINESVKALGRYLATPSGRRVFVGNNWQDETTIVACHESEHVGDVFERAYQHAPPVLVAVYYPKREREKVFEFIHVAPGGRPDDGDENNKVGKRASIGMFADSLHGRGVVTCQFGDWASMKLGAFDLVAH